MKLTLKSCLCQVALLVQFLIENSGEIFGGDIASLFQRLDKKKSKTSEESPGKLVILCLPEMFKVFEYITFPYREVCFPFMSFPRKSTEKQLGLVSPLPVRHRQESRAKQRAEVHPFKCITGDGCLSLWLLFNLLQPSQEISIALALPYRSKSFLPDEFCKDEANG